MMWQSMWHKCTRLGIIFTLGLLYGFFFLKCSILGQSSEIVEWIRRHQTRNIWRLSTLSNQIWIWEKIKKVCASNSMILDYALVPLLYFSLHMWNLKKKKKKKKRQKKYVALIEFSGHICALVAKNNILF